MSASHTESQIKSLLVRERYYRDTCQWEKLRAAYHPDASKTHIEITWFQGDVDGFVAGSKGMTQGGTGALHTISPVEVHLNGDRAVSESMGSITIRFEHDGHEFDCTSITRFISRLENVGGDEWKMLTLEAIYERDCITPTLPSAAAAMLSVSVEGRSSYKCISWLLGRKGFAVKQDLPGVDRPESCDELMTKTFAWLHQSKKQS